MNNKNITHNQSRSLWNYTFSPGKPHSRLLSSPDRLTHYKRMNRGRGQHSQVRSEEIRHWEVVQDHEVRDF